MSWENKLISKLQENSNSNTKIIKIGSGFESGIVEYYILYSGKNENNMILLKKRDEVSELKKSIEELSIKRDEISEPIRATPQDLFGKSYESKKQKNRNRKRNFSK